MVLHDIFIDRFLLWLVNLEHRLVPGGVLDEVGAGLPAGLLLTPLYTQHGLQHVQV